MANWKAVAKHGAITLGEVGVIGTSMLLSRKFLDARTMFAKQAEKDPTLWSKWYIKHQGAIKFGVGAIAATMIKNPWLKLIAIGVAADGFITEARVVTTNKDGVSWFESIGQGDEDMDGTGASDIDQEMLEAAKQVNTSGYGDRYATAVSGYGNRYATDVSGFGARRDSNIDLNDMRSSYVSGFR